MKNAVLFRSTPGPMPVVGSLATSVANPTPPVVTMTTGPTPDPYTPTPINAAPVVTMLTPPTATPYL